MKKRFFALLTLALLAFLVDRTAYAEGSANDCEIVIAATCGDAESNEENIVDYKAIEGSAEIFAKVQCSAEAEGTTRQVVCVPSQH